MGTNGEPCWIQLSTDDVDTAISFYGELFDWSAGEPSTEYQGYRMFFRGEEPIAGLVPTAAGARPTWTVFLATADLAGTAERAVGAGGSVIIDPTPVAELGSFAELTDPAGAPVGAWQADTFSGFAVRNQTGAPGWFETLTNRYDEALEFYRSAFGWETHVMSDSPEFRYTTLGLNENARAGVMDASGFLGDEPSRWQFYLQVSDTDETVANAVSVGGTLVHAAEDTPYGRVATLMDPAGVRFCVMAANW
jgi:predicted enzyme related to lactoylglutathione lyase